MSGKLEIQWSPFPNKFITWGTDTIYLYQVKSLQEATPHVMKISNTHCADVFACTSNQDYVKTLDICPKSEKDLLLALGLCNGKVVLTTFGYSEWDTKGIPGKELIPRHARQCNTVLFSPLEHNLLANGLDKYKPDSCLLIWDTSQLASLDDSSNNFGVSAMAPAVELVKPVWEFGPSESCQSVSWFHQSSRVLAAGMNCKHIRLYDLRDSHKPVNQNMTKAAYGVCTNPQDDRYLASYFENQLYVWDTRNIEKPIVVLPHSKFLLKIGWCPTKNNLLTSLQKESGVLSLYDIQHPVVGNEEVEPTVLERVVNPGSPHQITSFSWHPTDENRILTVALSGTILDYKMFDRITLNWSPVSQVTWSCGRRTMKYVTDSTVFPDNQDISIKMKERAKLKYGLQDELFRNARLVQNDEVLSNVWNWLHLSSKLIDDGKMCGVNYRHPGVLSVLKIDPELSPSETITKSWAELGHLNCEGSAKYYKYDRAIFKKSIYQARPRGSMMILRSSMDLFLKSNPLMLPDKKKMKLKVKLNMRIYLRLKKCQAIQICQKTLNQWQLPPPYMEMEWKIQCLKKISIIHEDRDKALQLCSWPISRESSNLITFIENLEREGAYTRAAAIAVFNLKVQLAIEILSRAPSNNEYGTSLNVVAMALAGFSNDPNSVWKSFCSSSRTKLTDAYLKAMFAFLTAENSNYDNLLNESGIAVDDRVAFACMFLPDNKLLDFMKKICEDLCAQGNLDGLLLTGNSPQGLRLLQKYLDATGDIQSATLIAVRAFHNELGSHTIKNWIENYQTLLNIWKLWFERAEFDLMVLKYKNEKPPQQIYISCSYCCKSISAHLRNLKREQYSRMTGTGTCNKLSACPNCRKPMPRCTICLMNMGTTIGDADTVKPTDFDNWFTWCQHCRHGGHSRHMVQWFEDHLECPMTGCTCRCFSLDYVVSRNS